MNYSLRTNRAKKLFSNGIALFFISALSACSEPNLEAVAKIKHDFNSSYELTSYKAEPKSKVGQAEKLAQNQYGSLLSNIKSPQTIFMCLWRNTDVSEPRSNRPNVIFLSCNFAASPVENSGSLVEMAELYNTIDRALLTAQWELKSDNYVLSRFELEIQADGKSYRSQNFRDNMREITVVQADMAFPKNANDSFHFRLTSKLPFRQNNSDKQGAPIVSISASGTAEPIPNWVNY